MAEKDTKARKKRGSAEPETRAETRPGDMSAWDLLKAGAIVAVIVLIAKILLDLLAGLAGFLRQALGKAWGIFKTNVILFVAIPIALAFLAGMFPGSAEMLDDLTGGLKRSLDGAAMRIDIPDLFGSSQPLQQPLGLAVESELRGCTSSMRYSSTSQDGEQVCIDLCKERGYTSYGIVKDGNSYECYCCRGSGTMIIQ